MLDYSMLACTRKIKRRLYTTHRLHWMDLPDALSGIRRGRVILRIPQTFHKQHELFIIIQKYQRMIICIIADISA